MTAAYLPPKDGQNISALIVGGSLGGLSTALALAQIGVRSTVIERTASRAQRGVAIRVIGAPLEQAIGERAYDIVADALGYEAISQGVLPHAWWDVYVALRAAIAADPSITLIESTTITAVGQNEGSTWARSEAEESWTADMLIGADGYRSIVRGHVASHQQRAPYAGYIVWLGQSEIPDAYKRHVTGVDFMTGDTDMLAVYPLIEKSGQLTRYGWGWFDPTRNALMCEIGAVRDGHVMHTPRVGDIPDEVYQSLERQAEKKWSEPWRSGLVEAIRNRELIATPISEYVPKHVVKGRVALIGDAAHAQTPMTGAGFEEAVEDAAALVAALRARPDPEQALQLYEHMRLDEMRDRVLGGQSFSRSFAKA